MGHKTGTVGVGMDIGIGMDIGVLDIAMRTDHITTPCFTCFIGIVNGVTRGDEWWTVSVGMEISILDIVMRTDHITTPCFTCFIGIVNGVTRGDEQA